MTNTFDSPSAEDLRIQLIAQAREQMAAFPQYANRFDHMQLGRCREAVETKLGYAMHYGDYVLFEEGETRGFFTIWSWHNECLTSVPVSSIRRVIG